MSKRYGLRDGQWEKIEKRLPGRKGTVGITAKDNRVFVEVGCRGGTCQRDLEIFESCILVSVAGQGVWEQLFKILAEEADNEYAMLDATIVRAHQHSAGAMDSSAEQEAIGRSTGGLSTKIHAMVDALGATQPIFLTPGQSSDLVGADVLLPQIEAGACLGDKAYDANERVIIPLIERGIEPVIPFKRNRREPHPYAKVLYQSRHLIENFFAKLKQFRAIATRCDEHSLHFLSGIYLATSLILLV